MPAWNASATGSRFATGATSGAKRAFAVNEPRPPSSANAILRIVVVARAHDELAGSDEPLGNADDLALRVFDVGALDAAAAFDLVAQAIGGALRHGGEE